MGQVTYQVEEVVGHRVEEGYDWSNTIRVLLRAPNNLGERAKMSFTISYKKKIVTCPYESLFTFFFLCSPSSAPCSAIAYRAMTVIVPSTAVVVRAVAAAVTVIVIMPFVFYCCCFFLLLLFRGKLSFFFFLLSTLMMSTLDVCLWLLLLVLLIDCIFLGVHYVCLLLHWHFLRLHVVVLQKWAIRITNPYEHFFYKKKSVF